MSKESVACDAIEEYLDTQNRPFSATDIHQNLHGTYGKTLVQKCLDALVFKGKVKEKVYNKQKVYVISQDNIDCPSNEELIKIDEKTKECLDILSNLQDEIRDFTSKLSEVNSLTTIEAGNLKLQQLEYEEAELAKQIQQLKVNMCTEENRNRVLASLQAVQSNLKRRQRYVGQLLNLILEGWPLSKEELFKDIGIESL